jgi:leucyl-tRNA synthetase
MATLPADQLPIELPELVSYKPTSDGRPPLARAGDDWLLVTLPDGRVGVRETNTMPQWAGSCWYYLRFVDPHNQQAPWDAAQEQYWLPVDLYVGGVEHAVLHLLYARFWHKVLYDCGLVSTKEPFQQLFNQGLILAHSYRDANGKYYYPQQVEEQEGHWVVKETGKPVNTQLEKMSKSRFNIVSLDEALTTYGADALRLYEVFIGPVSAGGPWQTNGIEGTWRFLQRVWRLVIDENTGELSQQLTDAPARSEPTLDRQLHKTIKGVTAAIESLDKMNTAVSHLMGFANQAGQAKTLPRPIIKALLALLSPFAPHICDELWQRLGEAGSMAYVSWPQADEALISETVMQMAVQVNGKLRSVIEVDTAASQEEIQQLALAQAPVRRSINGQTIRKVIVAPGRLVNFLTSG